MQRNISLRSADAICSPVVKGRSVGSVCANSCELTAYIGLPFCCVLASQPLYHVSVFVRLYPHPRASLLSPQRLPSVQKLGRPRSRFKPAQKKNRASDGENAYAQGLYIRRNLITFGGFNFRAFDATSDRVIRFVCLIPRLLQQYTPVRKSNI